MPDTITAPPSSSAAPPDEWGGFPEVGTPVVSSTPAPSPAQATHFNPPELAHQELQEYSSPLQNSFIPGPPPSQLPAVKPDAPVTPVQRSLDNIANNPLSLTDEVSKATMEQASKVPSIPPPAPPVEPLVRSDFTPPELANKNDASVIAMQEAKVNPDLSDDQKAQEVAALKSQFVPPELAKPAPEPKPDPANPQPSGDFQTWQSHNAAFAPPELGGVDADMGPEQPDRDYAKYLDSITNRYADDPEAVGKGMHSDHSVPLADAANAVFYAQQKYDNKENGMSLSPFSDYLKTAEQVKNATSWISKVIANGWNGMVVQPLQIPGQLIGAAKNASDIISPEGADDASHLTPGGFPKPWERVNQPMADLSQGTTPPEGSTNAGINPDVVPVNKEIPAGATSAGINTDVVPVDTANLVDLRRQAAERALVAGAEEGNAQHTEWAEGAISKLIGLTSTAPNAALKLFGGPEIGHIDPHLQTLLAANPGQPIPILSDKSYNDMDPKETIANLFAGRVQDSLHTARGEGHVGQGSEAFLNAWDGKTVNTPEELQANGVPVPRKAIQDTAAITNLAESSLSLGLTNRLMEAAGLNSVLDTSARSIQQHTANILQDFADNPANAKELPGARWLVKEIGGRALSGATSYFLAKQLGLPAGLSGLVGSIVRIPVSDKGIDLLFKSAGLIPKAASYLADNTADALRLAANDPNNLLATRSAAKQLFTQGIKRSTEGVVGIAPALLGARGPEDIGSLLGLGVSAGIAAHAVPDLVNLAQNRIVDSAFITDNNRNASRAPAAPPTPYKTNPALDAAHAQAITSVDPVTNQPLLSNGQRRTINDLRTQIAGLAELYVLNPKAYEAEVQRMSASGYANDPQINSRGVAIDPNPGTNQARVLVRSDYVDQAIHHELSHPIVNRMSPEDLQTAFQAYTRTNDPNDFTENYTRLGSQGTKWVDYDHLPTEAGVANGTEQYAPGFWGTNKEDMQREMATEAVSGLLKGGSIRDLTRDPTMLHQTQQMLWRVLDGLGLDPVTTRANSVLGLKQSIPAALVLEPLIRDTLRRNLGANVGNPPEVDTARTGNQAGNRTQGKGQQTGGPTTGSQGPSGSQGPPPPSPNGGQPNSGSPGIDESLIQGMMRSKARFSREEAIRLLQLSQQQGNLPSQKTAGSITPQAPTQSSGPSTQAHVSPSGESQAPPDETTQQGETTESSTPLQKVLRESGKGISPSEAQSIATGSGERRGGLVRGIGRDMPGKIGFFGYASDATWDSLSGRGIGAFRHTSRPGSLIPGYSIGLTAEGMAMRGVRPGQEVSINGTIYRVDDLVPSHPVVNGKVHDTPVDYVDLYDPDHKSNEGVSEAEVARRQAIHDGVKGIGERGDQETGENAPEPKGQGSSGTTTGAPTETPPSATSAPPAAAETTKPTASPITHQDITNAESEARSSIDQGRMSNAAFQDAINQAVLAQVGRQHAAGLEDGDSRVAFHPESGFSYGTHFEPSDPLHQWMFQQLDPATRQHQIDVIQQIEPAIQSKSDLFLNYKSAPTATELGQTGAERSIAQAKSAAADRAQGLADIQTAGKELIPFNVGFALGKGGNPSTLLVSGVSADKVASNLETITHALGPRSPYPMGPMGSAKVAEDLRGYLENVSSGVKGTGEAPITPLPGHESDVPATPAGFQPYKLNKASADLFNLAVNGSGAKLSTGAKAEKSAAAFDLASHNFGYSDSKAGYTNALAQRLDAAKGPQPVIDPKTSKPKLGKDGKPVTEPWTKSALHSGYETLRADLVDKVNKSGESADEKIHPGHSEVAKGLQEGGLPPAKLAKSGFLPAESKTELSTEDLLKKNEHMIAGLERKQRALDLDDPAESDQWDALQTRIHDVEK
jgi:hypothetical protein